MLTLTATSTPNLENHFFLPIWNVYDNPRSEETVEPQWRNPHLNTIIKPYIPEDNKELIETFKSTIPENTRNSSSAEIFFSCRDVASLILSYPDLSLTDVITFSTVNKNCYLATKADVVWKMQLSKLLPQVKFISQELCTFTFEQQYKIICKRIDNELKPYFAKFRYNQDQCHLLKKELAAVELQLQRKLDDKTAESRLLMHIPCIDGILFEQTFRALENTTNGIAKQLKNKISVLKLKIVGLVGKHYDGSIESIDPNSDQGRIKHGIEVLVPDAFNNQVKFEETIRKSEAIANNSSSLNSEGPTVEDITDVEDTDPTSGENG